MKIYYVANARMPSEKAHGIQIAKMCEAFIEEGIDLMLVVPRRGVTGSLKDFYHLRVDVPITRIPAINLYNYGRLGYFVSSLSFMFTSLVFLWRKRWQGGSFVVYTVDLDNYSSSALPLAGAPLFTEMHGGKPNTYAQRFLFKHLRGVFAINHLIIDEFKQKFSFSHASYLAEPNGVDIELFAPRNKAEARVRLGLPPDVKIALYVGRFFEWKGLEILPQAAELVPEIEWRVVGGDLEEFCRVTGCAAVSSHMRFFGSVEQVLIPWWLAAADALVVLGTKRDRQSYFYTSPMKLFEYLLSERAIVASDTPAIRQIVSEQEVFLYEPDNAQSLAAAVREAVLQTADTQERISKARRKGEIHTWGGRARRILESMKDSLNERP